MLLAAVTMSAALSVPAAPIHLGSADAGASKTDPGTTVVSSARDSGPGTLRRALLDAAAGDTIAFDPAVFPPDGPTTITVESELPHITQGALTIDASDAGVILDGAPLPRDSYISGLEIESDGNTIRGLQLLHFTASGIGVGGRNNTIGGDRGVGVGPIGQGNLTSRNGNGIGLWGSAEGNVVAGNLIGTKANATQPLGNRTHGVWLAEQATRNVIGPDNVIAFNGESGVALEFGAHGNTVGPGNVITYNGENGIWVDGRRSRSNTITRNSVHHNAASAVYLSSGGNAGLIAPSVLDLDLATGTAVGTACPACTVELFSDEEDEAAIFEGGSIANEDGLFALTIGRPFAGPHLTAVSIDAAGNSSTVAPPASGPALTTVLQEGNRLPRATIPIKDHLDLIGNRIGDMWDMDRPQPPCPPAREHWYVNRVLDDGFTWVRLSLDPREWWGGDVGSSRYEGPFSSFEINRCQDRIITALSNRGITIVLTIVFWDQEFHADRPPDYGNEPEVRQYLRYVRLLARHFRDRVRYFEILNEPVFYVDLPDYLDLVRRAIPIIRREAPKARIVAGGAAYLLEPENRRYLFGVLRSDVVSSIDAIELHPMYGSSPEYDDIRQYYFGYPALIGRIKEMARANGFTGQVLAEEMLWRTPHNAVQGQPWVYTPITAAKYLLRGIVINRGLGIWAGIATPTDDLGLRGASTIPAFFQIGPRLTTVMDGAKPVRLPVRIETDAAHITSYGFSLPNGDRMLAVWSDGPATDEVGGIRVELSFTDTAAKHVVGIDVFTGFEQELVTTRDGSDLVIRSLIVKDFPIFVRLAGPTS